MIELRSYDEIPGGTFRGEWRALVDEDPDAGFFSTPRYLDVWHRTLGVDTAPRVHGAYRDGRLIGVIPLGRTLEGSPTGPIELVRFLGGTDVTDYLGPVARPEDRDDIVAAYVRRLVGDADWDEFVAEGLPADVGWADAFHRHAEDAGLEVIESGEHEVCPRVDLSDGYDAYLKHLGSKQRHELRRKARKLQRDAGEVRLVEVAADANGDALDRFFAMAREIGDDKSRFFANEAMQGFFAELSAEFAAEGTVRMHELEVGGLVAASAISVVFGQVWGLYNTAFDDTLSMLAPGMVLVAELIRLAGEGGCTTFDLLRGDEPYKYRFGAEDRPLRRVTLVRS